MATPWEDEVEGHLHVVQGHGIVATKHFPDTAHLARHEDDYCEAEPGGKVRRARKERQTREARLVVARVEQTAAVSLTDRQLQLC